MIHRNAYGTFSPEKVVGIASSSKWISGGVIMALVDAGEIARVHEPGYLPGGPLFDKAVQYEVRKEDEVDAQLMKLGFDVAVESGAGLLPDEGNPAGLGIDDRLPVSRFRARPALRRARPQLRPCRGDAVARFRAAIFDSD